MWDLAFKFLGDPFKWPELWHANTSIKNPDLIYPGNSLTIPTLVKKSSEGVGVPESESMTSLSSDVGSDRQRENQSHLWGPSEGENADKNRDHFMDSLMNVTVFRSDFITSDLIGQMGFLWFDKDAKGLIYPGNGIIVKPDGSDPLKNQSNNIYRQFDEIVISIFGKSSYTVGDTIDVYHSDRFVRFKGKTANLVRRIARARMNSVAGSQARAVLFKVWDIVSEGDRIETMAHIPTWEIDTVVERDVVIRGTIFERIEATESPYLFQTLICDRGAQDGVRFGDVFLIYPQGVPFAQSPPCGLGCACSVGAQTSTLVIEKLFDSKVALGDTIELIKRIRFK